MNHLDLLEALSFKRGPKDGSQREVLVGPCTGMVYTWALKGLLYPYFRAYVSTLRLYGPLALSLHPLEARSQRAMELTPMAP